MKIISQKFNIQTKEETEKICITMKIKDFIKSKSFKNGLSTIMVLHSSAAITINENMSCISDDIVTTMRRIVPESDQYHHARYIIADGRLAVNAPAHIQSSILGNHVHIVIKDGEPVLSNRQDIFFIELDGPRLREYVVEIMGE